MDAVVRGRVEDELDRLRQPLDPLGVDPELVDQARSPAAEGSSTGRSRAAPAAPRTAAPSSAPRSGAARSRGCSAGRSGGRRGWPRRRAPRGGRGGTSSRRSRRRRRAGRRSTTRRPASAAGVSSYKHGVDDDDDQLPDRVDDDVAAAHRQARSRVPRLVADQVLVARVLEREQLDDEQQDEGRDRVEDQFRHAPNVMAKRLSRSRRSPRSMPRQSAPGRYPYDARCLSLHLCKPG